MVLNHRLCDWAKVDIEDIMLEDMETLIFGRATFNTVDSARVVLDHLLKDGRFRPQYWGALPPLSKPFDAEHLDDTARLLVNQRKQELTPDTPSGDIFLERRKKLVMTTTK